jgi:subtilisin family serine protease
LNYSILIDSGNFSGYLDTLFNQNALFMKMKFTLGSALTASILFLGSCTEEFNRQEIRKQSTSQASNFVPGELLIKIKSSGSTGSRVSLDVLNLIKGELVENITTSAMKSHAARIGEEVGTLILAKSGLGTMEAIQMLQGNPDVEYAEPNWIYHHFATSNDPKVTDGSLWGMYSATALGGGTVNQFGSGATTAWADNKTDCSSVYIGIIDEGYMFSHEDLAANAATNPGETAGDGIDNDGNGLVDDVYGWDFDGNNNTVFDGTGDDHGTHVAGTIGGVGGNGKGVAGVCWSIKLLNAKFLGSAGGTTANAVKAVDYFTDLKTRNKINLIATSNSWGGGGYSQTLADAITRAGNAEILFIAAAGNSSINCERRDCYPAEYGNSNVIAVASTTSTGAMSSFSNYGSSTIDIGAPGSTILSTLPNNTYNTYSGTSMATPHVSGAAALYAAYNPGKSAADIKAAILNSATPTSSLSGKVVTGGRLNIAGLMNLSGGGDGGGGGTITAPVISSVTGSTSANGTKSATIVWTGSSTSYDVIRDNSIRVSNLSGLSYRDNLGKYSGTRTYKYKVCASGSSTACSSVFTLIY